MKMRNLYKKSVTLLILLFAVGWANGQEIQQNNLIENVGTLNGSFIAQGGFSKDNPNYIINAIVNPEEGGLVTFNIATISVYDFEDGVIPSEWNNTISSYPWTIWSPNPYNGSYCMTSGNYNISSSESFIDVTMDFIEDGSIEFYSRISSESINWDYGKFYIDGAEMLLEGGTSPNTWTARHYDVTAGTHTFRWYYYKDSSVDDGEDRYYIDDITFTGVAGGESSMAYQLGETCTLSAIPADGYVFANWTEDGEEVSSDTEYAFTVTGDRNLVANFNIIPIYTISAYANPEEGGYIEGDGEWYEGETCTLMAYANSGYQFNSWRENGEVVSESPSYTFTVLSDRIIEAYFVESGYYMLSLNTVPEEGGTLMTQMWYEIETPVETEEPIEEQDFSFMARASEGWRFVYWTANDEVVSYDNVYTFHLSEDTELEAHFEQCELETEPDPDLLSGRFSISGCTTVGFAKGNLIAQIQIDTINNMPNPTSASWQFAETQYYRQEYDASSIATNGIGSLLSEGMDLVWDLFRSVGLVDIACWHQLSGAEWEYLLNGRPIEVRYAFAKVNDVAGLLVLPDDWDASTYQLESANTVAAYETNIISLSDWENMEEEGALFLPANGMLTNPIIQQGQYQYQFDPGDGSPVGIYGNMMFHPQIGVENGFSNPQWGYIMAEAGLFSSLRLAQIVEQASSTVTVAVDASQTDLGTVSGGGGFACGEECTVIATANDGYVFRYWLEGDEVASVDAEYTFAAEGDRSLTAVFADMNEVCNVEFDLVSDPNYVGMFGWGGEAIQLSFDDGTPSIALTMPVPEMDWNVLIIANMAGQNVSLNDFDFPQSQTFTLPINKGTSVELSWLMPSSTMTTLQFSHTFSASYETGEPIIENAGSGNLPFTFQCNCEDITLAVDPEVGGYIITEGTLNIGETVTFTAVANEHFTFVNWTFNGIEVSTDPTYSFMVTEEGDMVAHFELLYDIAISVSSSPEEGGTVSGDGMFGFGTTCTVTAIPNEGYSFMYWTENGNVVSSDANYSFTVTEDRDLVANFSLPLTIIVETYPIEGGVANGGGVYTYGSTCTLIAEPNNGYIFNCWTENGIIVSTTATYSFSVQQDGTLVASFSHPINSGVLSGLFSVSDNDRINFSQGNLQFKASSIKWRFAEHQWDYVGGSEEGTVYENGEKCDNTRISGGYSGWIDLFGWGTSGYHDANDPYDVNYQPCSSSDSLLDNEYNSYGYGPSSNMPSPNLTGTSANYDWGYNAISNGCNTANSSLRTLSHEEWSYLLYTRSTSSGIRFAKAQVNGVNGMILLPDDWKISIYGLYDTNNYYSSYESNVITAENWAAALEANGAVFLPAAGDRYGTTVTEEGLYGYYWSSSYYNSHSAWRFAFAPANIIPIGTINRAEGQSVRLASSLLSITASVNSEEGGTIVGRFGEYVYGTRCIVTANPNEGYVFGGWDENGEIVSTNTVYKFTVTSSRSLVANFGHLITATADPYEGGSIEGAGIYSHGDECTLTASANTGYTFINWTMDGIEVTSDTSYSFIVTQNATYVANFEANNYEVSVTIDPLEGGSVLGEGEYDYGTTCTLSSIPNDGYVFLKWTDSFGNVVSNEPTYSFTVTGDVNFTAIFETLPNGVYIGTGGSATLAALPSMVYFRYSISQQIYTQSEIGDAMEIVNLSFYNEGDENVRYYEIYMVHTDMTSIDLTTIDSTNTGWVNMTSNDRVFNGVVTMSSGCWNTIILGRPFAYDGVSNLAIIVYDYTGEGHWNDNMSCRVYNSDGIQAIFKYGSSSFNPYDPPISWYYQTNPVKNQIILNREPEVTITATAEPEQGGTIVGAGDYIQGTECTLYAIPNDNYTFLYWTENDEEVSFDATYYFTVTTDRNLVAHFVLNNQTISLNSGWTWLSTYVEQNGIDGLGMLENGLDPNGVMIKSQRDGFLSYANGMWIGTLDAITNEKMYLVNTSASTEVTFTGPVAQLNAHPITLNPNWTWLGYPSPFAVDVDDALSNLNPTNGDVVKSQSSFATYSDVDGWYGTLSTLTPGMGLMYQSLNSQPVTFNYGVGMSRALKANLTAENNHWVPDIHAYPNNMNIMAVVELNGVELQDERYELAVFNGSECRGSARLVYVPSLCRHVAFLTVTGEDDVELYLALYDTMTGKAYYNTTDCPNFEANAVVGSLSMPFVARFGGTTNVDEWNAPNIELYPNPVMFGHLFQMEMPAECQSARVSIVNALGAVISTTDVYDKPAIMRAPEVPGVYTVRIVTDKQGTFTRKLIVNK